MSRKQQRRRRDLTSFPRVSGDEPEWTASDSIAHVFSPRERG